MIMIFLSNQVRICGTSKLKGFNYIIAFTNFLAPWTKISVDEIIEILRVQPHFSGTNLLRFKIKKFQLYHDTMHRFYKPSCTYTKELSRKIFEIVCAQPLLLCTNMCT